MLTLNMVVQTKKEFSSCDSSLSQSVWVSFHTEISVMTHIESTRLRFKMRLEYGQFKLPHGQIWGFDSYIHLKPELLIRTNFLSKDKENKQNHNRFRVLRMELTLKTSIFPVNRAC